MNHKLRMNLVEVCVSSIGAVNFWQYYGLFSTQQAFILKPWFMMIVMMATDINYVRTFIIQIFLSPDHVGDMMPTRNGMSFLSQSVSTNGNSNFDGSINSAIYFRHIRSP